MRDLEHAMTLAAMLAQEASFIQHSANLRPFAYGEPPPHMNVRDALDLLKIGRGVASRAVRLCNGQGWERYDLWTEADDARRERADDKARLKAQAIADKYLATVQLGGDPRGYVVRLHLKSGRKNGMGDGWGVA